MRKIILFFCCLFISLISLYSQTTQMKHWYVGNKDVDFTNTSTGMYSYTTTTLPTTGREGATNGMYDISGNLIFFVEDGTVFDKTGANMGTFAYAGNENTNEITIVPFANSCEDYYVIYSTQDIYNTSKHAYVAYGKVTIDPITGEVSSITNLGTLGGYSDNQHTTECGFAVSKPINNQGDRYIYVVAGNLLGSSNYYGKVKRYTLSVPLS